MTAGLELKPDVQRHGRWQGSFGFSESRLNWGLHVLLLAADLNTPYTQQHTRRNRELNVGDHVLLPVQGLHGGRAGDLGGTARSGRRRA